MSNRPYTGKMRSGFHGDAIGNKQPGHGDRKICNQPTISDAVPLPVSGGAIGGVRGCDQAKKWYSRNISDKTFGQVRVVDRVAQ